MGLKTAAICLLMLALSADAARQPGSGQASLGLHSGNDSGLEDAKSQFLARFGDRYGYGGRIDELHAKEIAPRLGPNEHYMDFTAASLYWNSQVAAATAELQAAVFGNPHSASPSSLRTDALVEETRLALLEFFGADPEEYTLIFTRSGTGALHQLGETFPWTPASSFRFLNSNHNSLLGIREYARQYNASFGSVDESEVEAWLSGALPTEESPFAPRPTSQSPGRSLAAEGAEEGNANPLGEGEGSAASLTSKEVTYSLFGYPAYDNYAGVLYPLSWVKAIQARSTQTHKWKVLLDAAAFVPAHKLNLSETPADFVDLSFYKLFGYPTGIGALIVRRENVDVLRKGYWGGGSVFLATSALDWHYFRAAPEAFEHGTLNFLDIIALRHGLKVYETLGGVEAVQEHVAAVGEYLYEQLAALKHSNGAPLVRVFGKHHLPNRREVQGSTLNFEVLGTQGEVIGYKEVAEALGEAGFHLRSGCTCNPGACYNATGVRDKEVRDLALKKQGHFEDWEWIWVNRDKLERLPLGSIRVSLGMVSRFEDAFRLVEFIRENYTDATAASVAAQRGGGRGKGQQPSHKFPSWC